jgi:hypothetical protein
VRVVSFQSLEGKKRARGQSLLGVRTAYLGIDKTLPFVKGEQCEYVMFQLEVGVGFDCVTVGFWLLGIWSVSSLVKEKQFHCGM